MQSLFCKVSLYLLFFNVSSLVEWSLVSLHVCCHVLPIRNLLNIYVVFICLIGGYFIFFKKICCPGVIWPVLQLSALCLPYHLPPTVFLKNIWWTDVTWLVLQLSLRNDSNSFLNQKKRWNTPNCLRNDNKKQKWLPVPANRKSTYLMPRCPATIVNKEHRCFIALSRLRDLAVQVLRRTHLALPQRNRQESLSEVRTIAQRNMF
jgi:hypothetical protein